MELSLEQQTKLQYKIIKLITTKFNCNEELIDKFQFLSRRICSWVIEFSIKDDPQLYCLRWNLFKSKTNWLNEYYYLKTSGLDQQYLYFDPENGNYIKKKVPGQSLATLKMNRELWIQLMKTLVEFHEQTNLAKKLFNYSAYNTYLNQNSPLTTEDLELFLKIAEQNTSLPVVFSHNSLDLENVLYDGEKMQLIDFEWVAYNNCYSDLASLIVDQNLDEATSLFLLEQYNRFATKKLNPKLLWQFVYFNAAIAYQWAVNQEREYNLQSLNSYKKRHYKIMQQIKKTYNLRNLLKNSK
ncbi:hypothetical protein [[Mycoplasma] cavipharyngis]|uniref:hypothetical protein n=1 Tax=[Mycoplasma] cavipharyngis TaxID=92757 RepID=UPI0037047808